MDNLKVKRGEIWKVELGHDKIGSEQGGLRYGIILQNDIGNKYSTTTIIALCTTRDKHKLPTHFDIDILKPSTVMLEQILTVDKNRLIKKIRGLTKDEMKKMDYCLLTSVGLGSY